MTNPKQSKTLHIETLGEELSVYDWKRLQMHSLNPTAASVFELCDGVTSPEKMAAKLDAPKELIWQSLAELEKANLLQVEAEKAFWQKDISRRQFLKAGSAVAAAAIVSIMLPSPAAAQSAPATATPTPTPIPPSGPITRTVTVGTLPADNVIYFFAFITPITDAEIAAYEATSGAITQIAWSWDSGNTNPVSGASIVLSQANGGPRAGSSVAIPAGDGSPVTSPTSNNWNGNRPYNGFEAAKAAGGAPDFVMGDVTVTLS